MPEPKLAPQPEQQQVNPVTLAPELFQAVLNTLAQRPWAEVAPLMGQLIAAGREANPQ